MGSHALLGSSRLSTSTSFNHKRTRALIHYNRAQYHEKQTPLHHSRRMKRDLIFKLLRKYLTSTRAAHGTETGAKTTLPSAAVTEPGAVAVAAAAAAAAPRRLQSSQRPSDPLEELIEKVIFNCRFLTLLAVVGSLSGSVLCFIQGCRFVTHSYLEYIHASLHGIDTSHVILSLVQAIDVFLMATVMLIFGMGIYELFVNTFGLQREDDVPPDKNYTGSNLFGLFHLQECPLWLDIKSLHDLKTKLGHVIVMILLVGIFEKSKLVPITTGIDLLYFSASILMSSGCLYFLSKLHIKK